MFLVDGSISMLEKLRAAFLPDLGGSVVKTFQRHFTAKTQSRRDMPGFCLGY
jgi:hypothetical protein